MVLDGIDEFGSIFAFCLTNCRIHQLTQSYSKNKMYDFAEISWLCSRVWQIKKLGFHKIIRLGQLYEGEKGMGIEVSLVISIYVNNLRVKPLDMAKPTCKAKLKMVGEPLKIQFARGNFLSPSITKFYSQVKSLAKFFYCLEACELRLISEKTYISKFSTFNLAYFKTLLYFS